MGQQIHSTGKLDNFLHPQKYFLFLTAAAIPLHWKPELRMLRKYYYCRLHLGVPYYQAEIRPVEPDQVMLIRKGKRTISSLPGK